MKKLWKMKTKFMKLLHGATVGIYYIVGTELAGEEQGCHSFSRIGKKYPDFGKKMLTLCSHMG